jgi:RimJ/RimL family protein N-acetyltransferase
MNINTQLFKGSQIYLGPIDFEKDPEVESRWTRSAAYLRTLSQKPAYPESPAAIKKRYEKMEKEAEENHNDFYMAIRANEDQRLLGFLRIFWIEWPHGSGFLKMAIGDEDDRGRGFGSEALRLGLNYAFEELNLFRLSLVVGEDNPRAVQFFKKFGFVEEVRRRQAILRDGKVFDLLHLGLLKEEWRPE